MNIIPPTFNRTIPSRLNRIKPMDASDRSHGVNIQTDRRKLPDRRHTNSKHDDPMDLRQHVDRRQSKRVFIST